MFQYHQFASEKMLEACAKLPKPIYHGDEKLFFGSVHGTMAHILCADKLWYARIVTGKPSGLDKLWTSDDRSGFERQWASLEHLAREYKQQHSAWLAHVRPLSLSLCCVGFSSISTRALGM